MSPRHHEESGYTLDSKLLPISYQCPGKFLGIVDPNPRVSKSNQLHVVHLSVFLY
jgi:hypothetical protein